MSTILIACDRETPEVGREIEATFLEAGYNVLQAPARKDLFKGSNEDVDLVIIDATRDGRKGLCLARSYRSCSNVGIIVIHTSDTEPDPVQALEVGADDVLLRPYRNRELLARVNSLLRRMDLDGAGSRCPGERRGIRFDSWMLDLERRQLIAECRHEPLLLTSAEYDLLTVFLQHPCRVLGREDLSLLALGRPYTFTARTLDAQVSRLRKRLSTGKKSTKYIKSVRGVGYIFCARTYNVY